MKKNLALVLLSFALIGCTKAPANNDTDPPSINSVDVVKAQPQEASLAPGESGETVVLVQIKDGYQVNANPPSQHYLKATELELKPADGISVESVTYPDAHIRSFAFSETPLKVYEGEASLKVKLKADPKTAPGKHNLSAKLRVQACDEKVCYAPGALDLSVPVNIK